jgi:hypothetical protein
LRYNELVDAGLARIAFVSRRFNELKGLPSVAGGCAMLFGVLLQSVSAPARLAGADPMGSVSFGTLAVTFGMLAFEPRYRATFGNSVSESADVLSALATSLPLLLIIGTVGDMIGITAKLGGPSVAAVAVALGASIVVARDFSWRPYFVIPLVGAAVAIAITAATPAGQPFRSWEHDPQRGPVFLIAYAIIALAMVVTGILDHRLLVSTLGGDACVTGAPQLSEKTRRARIAITAALGVTAALTLALPAAFVAGPFSIAFSLGLTTFCVPQIRLARQRLAQIGVRDLSGAETDTAAPRFSQSMNWLWIVLALAIGAALDTSRLGALPAFLPVAFAGCAAAAAITDWPRRRHYLLGTAASALALAFGVFLEPAHALALFLCLAFTAVAIGMLVDRSLVWRSTHAGEAR